ncbi:MAG TPA: hypothetical protein VEV38_02895, partial [Candidatus Eremiobacteraceae bacterium]|nr:hypothetical protein [Candidatus Eremiobacteraceae bacterium]
DNTLSFSASSPLDTSIAYQFKLGYDFRHIAAQCQTDPLAATHLFCSQTPATHFEIYAFNITSPYYRIGYTLQPTKYSAGNTLVTAERVYNGFLQASLPRDKNVTVFASASNDTGVLAFVPVSRLIEATNIQLNITGEIKGIGDVLSVGATNQNGFLSNIPGEGLNFSRFPQRVLTTFVLVRIGTPALLTTPVSPGF